MILESPFGSITSIMSLCCLRMWRIWCALRLQRCGQNGHWKVGSLPHSYFRWRWRESLRTYDRPQRSQGNTPRARVVVFFGALLSFEGVLDSFFTTTNSEVPKLAKTSPQVTDQPDQRLVSPSKLLSEKENTNIISETVPRSLILIRLRNKWINYNRW